MEWIRISTNKLKIMLSAQDADRYALDCENADYADLLTREAFREILTDVREETGFDATEDKVYIQMYPSKGGGCELFVTKMGLLLTEDEEAALHAACEPVATPPEPPPSYKRRSCALCFAQLEHLLALCRRIAPRYRGESEVWQDEGGTWWLIITENGNPYSVREDYRFALDYGRMVATEKARAFLPEHGRCICPADAVAVMGRL